MQLYEGFEIYWYQYDFKFIQICDFWSKKVIFNIGPKKSALFYLLLIKEKLKLKIKFLIFLIKF